MKTKLVAIVLLLTLTVSMYSQNKMLSKEKAISDIDSLAYTISEVHPDMFLNCKPGEFMKMTSDISLTAAKAKNNISVDYTEESELVSVIAHLANVPGYVWPEEQAGVIDYFHQVDSTFAPYSNHPIMAFVTDSLVKQGFGYHVPVSMALRLKLKNGKLHYNMDLEPDFNHYYRGITPQHEKKLIVLLEDFYKKAHFHSFFKKNLPLYNACKQAMQQQLVNKIDLDWYKSFFGPIDSVSFHIYLGLLNGPGNYSIPQKTKDGSEIKNAFMGCADRNANGDIYYGEAYTLPVIIHEFNHSFCNPLNEEFWDDIKDKMTAFYNQNATFYAQQAYGDPLTVANETFVEACVMRYLATHPVQFTQESIKKIKRIYQMQNASDEEIVAGYYETQINIREVYKKFFMIRDIMKALEEREANTASYPTMHDFMPKYVDAINAFQEK